MKLAATFSMAVGHLLILAVTTGWCVRGTIAQFQCPGYPPAPADAEATRLFCQLYDFGFACADNAKPAGPKITVGHSVGGNYAYSKAAAWSSEMVCATPCGYKHADAPPQSSMKEVPVFTITGDGDFGVQDVQVSQQANATGLREAVAWHMGHEHNWSNPDLVYLFWAQCINLRYRPGSSKIINTPREDGWLGDMTRSNWETDCPYIDSYRDYKRDKSTAAWFPSRYFAYCWRAFVPCKSRIFVSPMIMTTPAKVPSDKPWTGYPVFKQGQSIPIKVSSNRKGEDRLDILWGDNLIESLRANAYGIYSTTWQNPEPGIHGLVAVAYKNNVPIATSRLVVVFVEGTVRYVPPAQVTKLADHFSIAKQHQSTTFQQKSAILIGNQLSFLSSADYFSLLGRRMDTRWNIYKQSGILAQGRYFVWKNR